MHFYGLKIKVGEVEGLLQADFLYFVIAFWLLATTVGIRIVANFEVINFQFTMKLNRVIDPMNTTKLAIIFIHCWRVVVSNLTTYSNFFIASS